MNKTTEEIIEKYEQLEHIEEYTTEISDKLYSWCGVLILAITELKKTNENNILCYTEQVKDLKTAIEDRDCEIRQWKDINSDNKETILSLKEEIADLRNGEFVKNLQEEVKMWIGKCEQAESAIEGRDREIEDCGREIQALKDWHCDNVIYTDHIGCKWIDKAEKLEKDLRAKEWDIADLSGELFKEKLAKLEQVIRAEQAEARYREISDLYDKLNNVYLDVSLAKDETEEKANACSATADQAIPQLIAAENKIVDLQTQLAKTEDDFQRTFKQEGVYLARCVELQHTIDDLEIKLKETGNSVPVDLTAMLDKTWHNEQCPTHSGKNGHYCADWDGLYICEDCQEYTVCMCPKEETNP